MSKFLEEEWPYYRREYRLELFKLGLKWGFDVRKEGEYEMLMSTIELNTKDYKPPKYDPFELEPPKSMIADIVKQWKKNAGKIIEDIRELRQNPLGGWLIEQKQREHTQLIHRIHRYEIYLDGRDVSKDWEAAKTRARQYPIADLITGKMRKSAGRFMGACPFHEDSTPSFVIYPNNTFHCFGCGANGDSIDFVMKRDNIDFKSAVKVLAG
jgi:hypothetical protein